VIGDVFHKIWEAYRSHGDLDLLRQEVQIHPWHYPPAAVDESLLYYAVISCDVPAARLLIELGERADLPGDDGFPLLILAIDEASEQHESADSLEMVDLLLKHGADPNHLLLEGTALHRAAGSGCVTVAELLLRHGANLEARMKIDGEMTPLMHAALMGHPKMVYFLLEAGADPLARCAKYMGELTAEELVEQDNAPSAASVLNVFRNQYTKQ
jgi:ankyrin repeat protein